MCIRIDYDYKNKVIFLGVRAMIKNFAYDSNRNYLNILNVA